MAQAVIIAFEENESECENALFEYMDSESIANYIKENGLYRLCCHAGALGKFESILRELYEDEEEIKAALGVK